MKTLLSNLFVCSILNTARIKRFYPLLIVKLQCTSANSNTKSRIKIYFLLTSQMGKPAGKKSSANVCKKHNQKKKTISSFPFKLFPHVFFTSYLAPASFEYQYDLFFNFFINDCVIKKLKHHKFLS